MNQPHDQHPILDDRAALHRFATTGDPAAFEIITNRYQSMVLGTCARILRSRADAEDATQETFLKLARHASQITSNLGAWLHAAAMGSSIDLIRRSSAIRRSEHAAAQTSRPDTPTPSDALHWSEIEPILDDALAALDPADRDLLVSRFLCTRTQREIAQELGVSEGTVSRRMDKALDKLRAQLQTRGVQVATSTALLAVLAGVPALIAPAALTSSVLKIPLFQSLGSIAGTATKPGSSIAIKAIGVGLTLVMLTGGAYLMTRQPQTSTPNPMPVAAMIPIANAEAPDRPKGTIGPFQIVSAGERNEFARGLWIREKRLAIRHGVEPESGRIKVASLEILAQEQDEEGVILMTRVRDIIPAGDPYSRFELGQSVDIHASFDEFGRIVLKPLTDGIQLGANEPRWFGVRPPLGWEEYGRIPDDAGPDKLLGPWTEAERIPVTITNREIRFGTDRWQAAIYRIVEWDKRDGYARVESIHAGGRDPRLIGSRFRLIIRKDDEGYTIAYYPPSASPELAWPSGFEYTPDNPVRVVTIRDLP